MGIKEGSLNPTPSICYSDITINCNFMVEIIYNMQFAKFSIYRLDEIK